MKRFIFLLLSLCTLLLLKAMRQSSYSAEHQLVSKTLKIQHQ